MKAALFLMDRCIGSSIHGILDALIASNYTLIKSGLEPMFEWHTISMDGESVMPINGLTIQPDYSLHNYLELETSPDLWILPPVFHSSSKYQRVEQTMSHAESLIPVIQQHYDKGGMLLSICSGSFLLAKAGLMQSRPALMHWNNEHHFHRMFPKLKIDTRKSIADYGNIICANGGVLSYEHLIMYLVERFAGHQIAVDTAKLLMMNLNASSPLVYRPNIETLKHSDDKVQHAQRYIERHCAEDINLTSLSERLNISDRQLKRRFSKVLNCSPLQYLQRIRINRACNLLEITQLPSNKIVYEVGYQDESSFRRLFKKHMDMTMENYRKQFGR
ncbi:MAG: helix-turn-helix domain-containing protein [Gammaproteobacteria bacterium]|nr:helix-turn-helix domain-containing protein [Gammaproteobacteria bacterium]MBT3724123.1 helix-turn-helix domain-containing protein [Gammaproteobacteria bacterium]MBT4075523.1 helix-turn-helix domain-containing protein [Gammaproteobacteria bacterium]MBT4193930.1 helix-turn-helix domain-containing protein [Gammaproteobacteria bacterium]MBT4451228.1 helix-turn-helix domain-containing protein [Gammaproteobacteria bacterium]